MVVMTVVVADKLKVPVRRTSVFVRVAVFVVREQGVGRVMVRGGARAVTVVTVLICRTVSPVSHSQHGIINPRVGSGLHFSD
jgi:hypothetical protein